MDTEQYELPQPLRLLKQAVANYIRTEIVPLERELDSESVSLPQKIYERLCEKTKAMGLWCVEAPEALGGGGFNCFWETVVREETAQHRNGLYGPGYGTFGDPPPSIMYNGNKEQLRQFTIPTIQGHRKAFYAITEPSGGSDPARAMKTRAVQDGNDWIINGSKMFISDAMEADYGLVFARTDPQSRRGITCFIVERSMPGFSLEPIPVIRPSYPAQLFLDNVRVPANNVLGEVHKAWDMLANKLLARARIPYSSANLGVSVAAQSMAIQYANQRETFGALLASRQSIQWMLVDSEIDIRACRWLTWEAAWKCDASENFVQEASIAKLFSSEVLNRVVDRAIQIHGGYGVTKALPLERWYREARVRRIGEGPSEIQRMLIARHLKGGMS